MFSILNRALSWAMTSIGNKFCLKKRLRLSKSLDNRFYVKFMQLEIGLLDLFYIAPGRGVPPVSHNALARIIYAIFWPLLQVIQRCTLHWKVTSMTRSTYTLLEIDLAAYHVSS